MKVCERQPVLLDNKINITKFRQVKIYTRNKQTLQDKKLPSEDSIYKLSDTT